ncbi:hypothetical protein [Methylobacterium sp. JK268]
MIARRSTRSAAQAAALAFGLLGAAAGPALAQGFFGERFSGVEEVDEVLAPRSVIFRLAREGYAGFTHPRFDGETYTLDADSPWGNRVRLVVDAHSGRVIERGRVEAPLLPPGMIPGRRPGFGWTEAEAQPLPPGAVRRPGLPPRDLGTDLPPAGIPGYGRDEALRGEPEPRRLAARPLPQPERVTPPAASGGAPAPAARGANPLGLNPDTPTARRTESPRRTARPVKPVESPSALVEPKPALKGESAPEQPAGQPAVAAASAAPAAKPTASADAGWKTPPEAGNRPVRVIDGVTPVPGKEEAGKASP